MESGVKRYFMIDKVFFDSLFDLISHYQSHPLRSSKFSITLGKPAPPLNQHEEKSWYQANLSRTQVGYNNPASWDQDKSGIELYLELSQPVSSIIRTLPYLVGLLDMSTKQRDMCLQKLSHRHHRSYYVDYRVVAIACTVYGTERI
jgi:hypothetical protein